MSVYPPSCCSPLTESGPTGEQGIQGVAGSNGLNGVDGLDAFTETTAAFIQPIIAGTVTIDVESTAWMAVGLNIFIANGGYYEITAIVDATSVTIENLGTSSNIAPGLNVAIGSRVVPSGQSGSSSSSGGSGFILVETFGAVGDGVTDDTAALQAAFDYLVTVGGTLLFSSGKIYMHSTEISIVSASGFIVDGNGSTLKTIAATPCLAGYAGIRIQDCSFFKVKNLLIDANRATRVPALHATHNLYLKGNEHFIFENVKAFNGVMDGAYIAATTPGDISTICDRGTFIRCHFYNCYRQGTSIIAGSNLGFYDCRFEGTTGTTPGAGVDIESNVADANESNNNIKFFGCEFVDNDGYGLQVTEKQESQNIVVNGCLFRANAFGGISAAARRMNICNNIFEDFASVTRAVIDLPAVAGWNSDIIITGNQFRNITALFYCIYVHSTAGDNIVVSSNIFKECYGGISAASQVNVNGNIFSTLTYKGVDLSASSDYSNVINNFFYECEHNAIYVNSNYVIISKNKCLDCNNTVGGVTHGTIRVIGLSATITENTLLLIATPDVTHYAIRIDNDANFVSLNHTYGYHTTYANNIYFTGLSDVSNTITAFHGYNKTDDSLADDVIKNRIGGKVVFMRNAAPVAGDWIVGDRVYNNAPIPTGTIGWVCTTAGTPGTWKAFGTIAA